MLSRKKGITKEFLINVYSKQKEDTDYLKDEEIEPIIEKIVYETLTQISDSYKKFLIDKYFGTEENLVSFITEDVYIDMVTDSINRNTKKINKNIQTNILKKFQSEN